MPINTQALQRLVGQAKEKVQDKSSIIPKLLPALAAGGAGGALAGYYSSKDHREGESQRARTHRIIRNALVGLTLGGTAGATIPAGINAMTSSAKPMAGFHPIDAAANGAVRHWLPTATGAAGAAVGYHHLSGNREQAAENIAHRVDPEHAINVRTGQPHPFEAKIMADLRNPGEQQGMLSRLGQTFNSKGGKPVPSALWSARELAGETGVHNFPSVTDTMRADPIEGAQMEEGLRTHLQGQGPISRLVAKLVGRKAAPNSLMSRALPSGTDAAEMYSKYLRPSVGGALGAEGLRIGGPATLGLIGGSMLGANYVQNKLEGN